MKETPPVWRIRRPMQTLRERLERLRGTLLGVQ